jgi:serine/threonine protein phosphatase PrpC
VDGAPLGRDALTSGEVKTTLYPVALSAAQLSALPQSTPTRLPTATPIQQTGVGGTAVPSPTAQLPTPIPATPTPLSEQVSLGAPAIDSNGRLIGMVVADAGGAHVLASAAAVAHSINAVTGKPGLLMQQWQHGLADFYATPPSFDDAAATFSALTNAYPDFGGVAPFAVAAQSHSSDIPSLTRVAQSTRGPSGTKGTPGLLSPSYALAVIVLLVAIALLLLLTLGRRARTAAAVANAPLPVTPSPELDLLPPDLSPEELDARLELETTMPLAAVHAPARGREDASTLKLPAVPPPLARVRQGLALMPHAAGVTDAGLKRAADPNQDNILAARGVRQVGGRVQPFGLFIVADGMGGHMHGQEASRVAIEIVSTQVLQALRTSQTIPDSAWSELLRDSVVAAGTELRRRNRDERVDMGTTLTAALIVDDMAFVANIGDSRTYLMSPETGLRQLTEDHSVVASLVAHGVIRPEDIYTHPRRNQIYRSLGGDHEQVDVDVFEVPLQAGDKLLLCSDGLWEMVRDPQIESILRGTADPRQAADLLLREANANGGEDNISAVVVRLLDDVPQAAETGSLVVVASPAIEAAGDRMAQGQSQAPA